MERERAFIAPKEATPLELKQRKRKRSDKAATNDHDHNGEAKGDNKEKKRAAERAQLDALKRKFQAQGSKEKRNQ